MHLDPAGSRAETPNDDLAASRVWLEETARGFFRGKVLTAAVQLGVADALRAGARSVEQLAEDLGADTRSLLRLLRTLASMGIVAETAPRRFSLASLGRPLCRDTPDSVASTVEFWADLLADQWSYLADCIRSGSLARARQALASRGVQPRMAADPARTRALFHGCFAESTAESHEGFGQAFDFSGARVVADLGGGGGGLLVSILSAHPQLRGVLVDREGAMQGARERISAAGVAERCEVRVGDLMDEVPIDADVYLMKHVLHIYDDAGAARLLGSCRRAMTSGDRLLVLEHVLPDQVTAADPALEAVLMDDLNMLAVTGGSERSEHEWRALLAAAGMVLARVVGVAGTAVRMLEVLPRS